MPNWTIDQAMTAALEHHRAGRLPEAEGIYRQVLQLQPKHADALNLLGTIALHAGHSEDAIQLIRQAISIRGEHPLFLLNLAAALTRAGHPAEAVNIYRRLIEINATDPNAYRSLARLLGEMGRFDEAVEVCQQLLRALPQNIDAMECLGLTYTQAGRFEEAQEIHRRTIAMQPSSVQAYFNLGTALRGAKRMDEAIVAYQNGLRLDPSKAMAYSNLGSLLTSSGRFNEAISAYQNAIRLMPDLAEAHNNLGNLLRECDRFDEALISLTRALELKPDLAEAHNTLGTVYLRQQKFDEAAASYERALKYKPTMASAHSNMGEVLRSLGRLNESIAAYRKAIELAPDDPTLHSNLLFTIQSHDDFDGPAVLAEHVEWRKKFADPIKPSILPHGNARRTDRRLRVGFVSPDFHFHPVGRFLAPLFKNHDAQAVEIVCYSDVVTPDEMTQKLSSCAALWHATHGVPDSQVAELIRADGVDILVDLALHAAMNRMGVFARKPAPVQVTWLAYAGTSGLQTMDYRLTDPFLDPPGIAANCYSEKSVFLETYWCYEPLDNTPPPGPLPADSAGAVTFGSMNSFHKVSPRVLQTWAALLRRLPGSRILLHVKSANYRDRISASFAAHGVDPARVRFVPTLPLQEYFQTYQQIDIALDPFPFCGGTTTCDALWMGVPVVTLAGKTAVGRGGVSILSHVGLPELIASTTDDYVEIAVQLASDLGRLRDLRSSTRGKMTNSILMDSKRFARTMEGVYQDIWKKWCNDQP